MMFEVTNNAPGPRIFQCVSGVPEGAPNAVTLIPGATQTLDLVDVDHPVLKAWAETGEVAFVEVGPLNAPKPKS